MTISYGCLPDANDILNIYRHKAQGLIWKEGRFAIPVIVNNVSGVRKVLLQVFGRKAGATAGKYNFGLAAHAHGGATGSNGSYSGGGGTHAHAITSGDTRYGIGANLADDIDQTTVPAHVFITIDGTTYVTGDPNGKGGTMYGVSSLIAYGDVSNTTTILIGTSPTLADTLTFYGGAIIQEVYIQTYKPSGTMYVYALFTYSDASTAAAPQQAVGTAAYTFVNPNPNKLVSKVESWAYASPVNVLAYANFGYSGGTNPLYIGGAKFGGVWGMDATTEWDTGVLDLSSAISWTAGVHTIEIVCGPYASTLLNTNIHRYQAGVTNNTASDVVRNGGTIFAQVQVN